MWQSRDVLDALDHSMARTGKVPPPMSGGVLATVTVVDPLSDRAPTGTMPQPNCGRSGCYKQPDVPQERSLGYQAL